MNTPEQTKKFHSISRQQYIPPSHHHHRRMQAPRDYSKILREYNKPAQWYQPPPTTRSIYFYDPNYQKYLRERLISTVNSRIDLASVQSTSRPRYTPNWYQQFQLDLPSRLQTVPTLPPINTPKGSTDE